MTTICAIAATSTNRVIGHRGRIPWHLPADMRRFRQLTMGHSVIMGRRTYESIGKPLVGRQTIVLSRQVDFQPEGVIVAASLQEALARVERARAFIAGGADVYREGFPLARWLYLTVIYQEFEGDTFLPHEGDPWTLLVMEHCQPDERNPYQYSFYDYVRPT